MKKEVLLIEFNESHSEVLHSQILFLLNKNYKVNLWINNQIEFKDIYKGKVKFIREKTKISSLNIGLLYKVVRFVQRNKIGKIILNTAHGILVRNLCLLLMKSDVEIIGVAHQAHKLLKSSTQKIISRKIKKYFVLNDYAKEFINKQTNNPYNVNSFYPIFFTTQSLQNKISNGKIIISIPGKVIQIRKDYLFLLNNILKLPDELKDKFQFIFLGTATKSESMDVLNIISENNIPENLIKIYKKHIPENEFNEALQKSDYIIPLIHPTSHSYKEYLSTEVSGAFNTAFAFKKPLLMYNSFNEFEDFKKFALFYNEGNFSELLNKLVIHDCSKEIKKNYEDYKKFSLDFQTENYIKFIES